MKNKRDKPELELIPEFIKKMRRIEKQKSIRFKSMEEFRKRYGVDKSF